MQQNKVMKKSLQLESHLYIVVATHIIAEAEFDGLGNNDCEQMVSDGQSILNDLFVATFDCEQLLSLVPAREQEESL